MFFYGDLFHQKVVGRSSPAPIITPAVSMATGGKLSRESFLGKPSPSSRRHRSDVPVHPRPSRTLSGAADVPGSGSLAQRLLRLAAAAGEPAGGRGSCSDREDPGDESRRTYGSPRVHASLALAVAEPQLPPKGRPQATGSAANGWPD